ncbi:MAG: hypothetical protein U0V48_01780 [Anaerolineales bacterium]
MEIIITLCKAEKRFREFPNLYDVPLADLMNWNGLGMASVIIQIQRNCYCASRRPRQRHPVRASDHIDAESVGHSVPAN